MATGRDGVGRLFLRNSQETLSEKMLFQIKQRSGGMVSAEEVTSATYLRREY